MKLNKLLKKTNLLKILMKIGIKNVHILDENIMGSCPLHEDKNPSWGINKRTGVYNCFSCGDKGNLITLIAKLNDISNKEAVKVLYKYAGIKMGVEDLIISSKTILRQIKKILKPKNKAEVEAEESIEVILPVDLQENNIYGIEYFRNRGINEEALKKHNIKFCTSGYYNNRAIIPIYKDNGELFTFEARDITGIAEKKVLYTKGAKVNRTIFNLDKAKKFNSVIIVEGLMDSIYLSQLGFNTVSTYGTEISNYQERLLSKYFKKVFIAFDGDKAGRIGAIKAGKCLSPYLSVYIITLPRGKDPDNMSKAEFLRLYKKAVSFEDYSSDILFNKVNGINPLNKPL